MKPDDRRRLAADRVALFLDFDGTFNDDGADARRGDGARGLSDLLTALTDGLGGALAVVTGREIADLDLRLAPFQGRAAGFMARKSASIRTPARSARPLLRA